MANFCAEDTVSVRETLNAVLSGTLRSNVPFTFSLYPQPSPSLGLYDKSTPTSTPILLLMLKSVTPLASFPANSSFAIEEGSNMFTVTVTGAGALSKKGQGGYKIQKTAPNIYNIFDA